MATGVLFNLKLFYYEKDSNWYFCKFITIWPII
jgi:hypothetical protein